MSSTVRESILVVDDVEENVDILVDMLSNDYDVSVAMDGITALEAAAENPPNIILLDIMMPNMDGFETCRRLKADEKTRKIPVIFISAIEDHESKVKALTLGGVDYVSKPFNPKEVMARVETHLELARTRRDLEETLSQTLTGTIQLLSDILSMTNPELFGLASRLQIGMKAQCRVHGLEPSWSFELAGMLLPLGMLAMSPVLLKKLNSGSPMTSEDIHQLDGNVELSSQLLSKIPRLELPIEVVRLSTQNPSTLLGSDGWDNLNAKKKAALILRLLREARHPSQEVLLSPSFVAMQLKELYGTPLTAPQGTLGNKPYQMMKLRISQMHEGEILMEDIFCESDGRKLAGQGFVLTDTSLILLSRFRVRGEVPADRTYNVYVPEK